MSGRNFLSGLLLAVVVSAPAAAQDRVIGLLALPEVHGPTQCAPFEPEDVPLHAMPNDGRTMAVIHVDRNWSFAPHGGCEGLEVSVHRGWSVISCRPSRMTTKCRRRLSSSSGAAGSGSVSTRTRRGSRPRPSTAFCRSISCSKSSSASRESASPSAAAWLSRQAGRRMRQARPSKVDNRRASSRFGTCSARPGCRSRSRATRSVTRGRKVRLTSSARAGCCFHPRTNDLVFVSRLLRSGAHAMKSHSRGSCRSPIRSIHQPLLRRRRCRRRYLAGWQRQRRH